MPEFTKEVRERLLRVYPADHRGGVVFVDPCDVRNIPADIRSCLSHIDALEARVADCEHRFTMTNVARGIAETQETRRRVSAEARVAVLAAECRASRKNDECANYCNAGVGPECEEEDWADATSAMLDARAATDASGALDGPEGRTK